MFKNNWFMFLINLLLTGVLFFLFAPDYLFLHYINSFFYVSFAYFLLFLMMYTAKGGFFDGVTFGFRRFNHVILKKDDYLDDWKTKPLPSEKINATFYSLLKFQSLGLFCGLLILLGIYFFVI